MQKKKILLISIVSLLLIGFVFAAGCTTTYIVPVPVTQTPAPITQTPAPITQTSVPVTHTLVPATLVPVQINSDITGTWVYSAWDDGAMKTRTLKISADGTGTKVTDDGKGKTSLETFTWVGNGPVFRFVFGDYDGDTYTLINGNLYHDKHVYVKQNQELGTISTPAATPEPVNVDISGKWTHTEFDDGCVETKTLTLNNDGTGTCVKDEGYGEIKIKQLTWTKTGPNTYLITFNDGETDAFVYSEGALWHDHNAYLKE